MKLWEYCRDLYDKHYTGLEAVGGKGYCKTFDWKKFAETGNCTGLLCNCCPFNGHNCIGYTTDSVRSELLNKELSEVYGVPKGEEPKKPKRTVMKEVLEWDNRPRVMWVWDSDIGDKIKRKVIYIKNCKMFEFKVIALDSTDAHSVYRHCAEITDDNDDGQMKVEAQGHKDKGGSMKEVTEWDNNPREMLVWDDNVDVARKCFVVYIRPKTDNVERPVLVCLNSIGSIPIFKHCAEIGSESQKKRLMTKKELSRWLRERPDREWKETDCGFVHTDLLYLASDEDEPVSDDIYVREGDSPWFVPFAEEA